MVDLKATNKNSTYEEWIANVLSHCGCHRALTDNEKIFLRKRYEGGVKVKDIWI